MTRKICILVGVFLCLFSSLVMGATEVYPLEQVYPGLKGIGKTVVQGTEIEEFDVEVITVIRQPAPVPAMVMVHVSGDAIDRSGGIASGMSGSPVYIDGMLLGAISYAYEYSDHRVGLVTPAGPMLDLMNSLAAPELAVPEGFQKIAAPVAVSGISGRSLNKLREVLEPFNLQLIPGVSGAADEMPAVELEPGSAFAVQLLRGDFQVSAFGTITEVDEHNRFVGFGHPFMHQGDVNFFVAPAVIHYTMPTLEVPYKIASAGESVGAVFQDRSAGVAGMLGVEPSYVPIEITVTDLDRKKTDVYSVESVADDQLLPAMVVSSAGQGIDSTLDRVGAGTAYVRFEFNADNLRNPIVRENMFYSSGDIAAWALSDLSEGLELLMGNNLQRIDLNKIEAKFNIENVRRTAEIEKAIPRSFQVEAGDSVEIEVRIRPYRGAVETRVLRIDIPKDTAPGPLPVTVRGGSSGYYSAKPTVHTTWESLQEQETDEKWREPTEAENLDMLLAEYMNRERNNELIAEFIPFFDVGAGYDFEFDYSDTVSSEDDSIPISEVVMLEQDFGVNQRDHNQHESIRVRLTTQYVIEGSATFEIQVL